MNQPRYWARGAVMALLVLTAVTARTQSGGTEGKIREFVLPKYDENMQLVNKIMGKEALPKDGGEVDITGLTMEFYKKGLVDVRVTAPFCTYNRWENEGWGPNSIRIAREDLVVTGDDFFINGGKERIVIKKNARVVIRNTDVRIWGDEK